MKRILPIILTLCMCLTLGAVLTACNFGTTDPEHTHIFKTALSYDDTYHWYACEDEACSEVSKKEEHVFADAVCNCGYKHTEHTYVDGVCDCGVVFVSEGLEYSLNDDGVSLTVTGIGDCTDAAVVIPETVVNNVGTVFTVTKIGNGAFDKLTYNYYGKTLNITSVSIPDSVTHIGKRAFYYADLKNVTFGENSTLQSVGELAFSNTSAEIDSFPSEITDIGNNAFYGCTIKHVSIPNGVTNIKAGAFMGCKGFTELIIPNSVVEIANEAFSGCEDLISITLPNNLTSIGEKAFNGCSSLESIAIPENVTTIGKYAFYQCKKLETIQYNATNCDDADNYNTAFNSAGLDGKGITVTIGRSVKRIPSYLFACNNTVGRADKAPKIVKVVFEEDALCESIGDCVFRGCSSLKSITIPNSVVEIGNGAFGNGDNLSYREENKLLYLGNDSNPFIYLHRTSSADLTSAIINEQCRFIGSGTFSNCSKLETVQLPDTMISIGEGAFYNCVALTSIEIPKNVTSIGSGAFNCCKGLTSIKFNAENCPDLSEGQLNIGSGNYFEYAGCDGEGIKLYIGMNVKNIPAHLFASGYSYGNAKTSYPNIEAVLFDQNSLCESIGESAFYGCEKIGEIEIPDTVTVIGNGAFAGCSYLEKVKIGNGVKSIGDSAFSGCVRLSNLTLGQSVQTISRYAFLRCEKIDTINIPNTLTDIEYGAFSDCNRLAHIYIEDVGSWCKISGVSELMQCNTNAKNLYLNKDLVTELVVPDSVTSLHGGVFYSCHKLTRITLMDTVTSIGAYAFAFCSNLTDVDISENVTEIGERAFVGCGITEIKVPNAVTTLGAAAFSGCSSLKTVTLGDGIQEITDDGNSGVFERCTALEFITLGSGIQKINSNGFNGCTNLQGITVDENNAVYKSVDGNLYSKDGKQLLKYAVGKSNTEFVVPNDVTSIAAYAFYGCSSLQTITFSFVETIGAFAFYQCTSLTEIDLPDSVMSMGIDAFNGCNSVENLNIGDGVKVIPQAAFENFAKLTTLTIGDGVIEICQSAFRNCTSLQDIEIPEGVTEIGAYAFNGCSSLKTVSIPNSLRRVGNEAFWNCNQLTRTTVNGLEYLGNKTNSYVYLEGVTQKSISSASIDQSCRVIGYHAFYDCGSLTDITIPDSVVGIGVEAFYNCNQLKNITFGKNLSYINGNAFKKCDRLENIHIGDLSNWWTVSGITNLMSHGSATKNLYLDEEMLTQLNIPNTVTKIDAYAFYGCHSLTTIIIPDTVTEIGEYAFYGCSALTSVNIPDAVTRIEAYTFYGCSSLTSITLPNAVTDIGNCAFYDCSSLQRVVIPQNVSKLGLCVFIGCSALTEIVFEDAYSWYRTWSSNYTDGTKTSVTNSADNAKYLVNYDNYNDYYWYKK